MRRSCLALLLCACSAGARQQRVSWPQAERVIAFADVHGAYDELTALLRSTGVVDGDLRWSAGSAQVVSLGDLLDRGGGSRKAMDLLIRLQGEAAQAGGALHVVLGNHEAMNLLGDLRDTTPAELAAYADEGGHRAALGRNGRYGRWLLTLPVAIVIGDTLFMHGGPSRAVAGLSLEEINRRYHAALAEYLDALEPMIAARLVRIEDPFADRAALVQQRFVASPFGRPDRVDAVQRFVAADDSPMLGADGPNWSRGAALCHEASESDVLEPVLRRLGVKRLVVGHTVTRERRAVSRFDGKLVKLDAGMNRAVYGGRAAALVIEGGGLRVVYGDATEATAGVPDEPLYVASPIPDDLVASVLERGEITEGRPDVVVDLAGQRVPAVFSTEGANKELAAFRLDRALRLGLVPATVEREVRGRRGVLQARPARIVTQAEVEAKSLRPDGWCALPPQFQLMDAFDALIGNEGRTRERMLYDPGDWMLLLTGHDRAFGTGTGLPPHLRAHPPRPGAEMRRRLSLLDEASLARIVGDLLTGDERRALLARRDALLRD